MTFHTTRLSTLVLGLAVLTAACSKSPTSPSDGGAPGGGNTATVTSVTVSGTLSVSEGSTSQLTATANMSDGTTMNVSNQATWATSNSTVATVSGTGLVTGVRNGTADVTALYRGQTGRQTLQVAAARYRLSLTVQRITALDTCDNFTQGLSNGEFATRVLSILPNGSQSTLNQTTGYPGNPSNLRVYNLGRGASRTLNISRTYTLDGAAGQFLRLQFSATEWDEQVVVFPPSTRWVRDSNMNNRSVTRTHTFRNGAFSGLGPNTLTIGNSSCGIRLSYTLSATKL